MRPEGHPSGELRGLPPRTFHRSVREGDTPSRWARSEVSRSLGAAWDSCRVLGAHRRSSHTRSARYPRRSPLRPEDAGPARPSDARAVRLGYASPSSRSSSIASPIAGRSKADGSNCATTSSISPTASPPAPPTSSPWPQAQHTTGSWDPAQDWSPESTSAGGPGSGLKTRERLLLA